MSSIIQRQRNNSQEHLCSYSTTKWCGWTESWTSFECGMCSTISSFITFTIMGQYVLTTTYLIIGHYVLNGKSFFEVLHKVSPNYSHLRIFGCLAYATILGIQDKFVTRSTPCFFLGYWTTHKGYNVLDFHTQKLFTSRDVIFHERVFPFPQPSWLWAGKDNVLPTVSTYESFDETPVPPAVQTGAHTDTIVSLPQHVVSSP